MTETHLLIKISFSSVFSAGIAIKMEDDKDTITFTISDHSSDMSEVGHIIIHENPASPVDSNEATPSESNDDISDNDSNDMSEVG